MNVWIVNESTSPMENLQKWPLGRKAKELLVFGYKFCFSIILLDIFY